MTKNVPKGKKKLAKSILKLLNKYDAYFTEIGIRERGINSPRDFAAHHGQIEMGTINIYTPINERESWPKYLSKKINHINGKIENLFDAEDLTVFCWRSFFNLCDFVGEVTGLLLKFEPKFGQRQDINKLSDVDSNTSRLADI